MATEHEYFDIVVVGAGISGINAAYRIQTETQENYCILEARAELGGTWSLFQYPGIRSDSDMNTLGFPFRPWTDPASIASGDKIWKYMVDTAAEFGIEKRIKYNHKLVKADFDSSESLYTLTINVGGETKYIKTRFVNLCSGYYNYDEGWYPPLPGVENFAGKIIQPQFWPKDLDWTGKKVVIVGSGATAITLLPNLADNAAHVTLLQRSPSYLVVLPASDPLTRFFRRTLPGTLAALVIRLRNVNRAFLFFYLCKTFPNFMSKMLKGRVGSQLPQDVPMDPHFTPTYKPWDQRVCITPDGDFFATLRSGKGSVVTDHIDTFTSNAIITKKGTKIDADIVISATGLAVQMAGGAELFLDGEKVTIGDHFIYKGMMLDGIPNLAICLGYTNASWTLGSDLAARYVCRVVNYMKRNSYATATPRADRTKIKPKQLMNLESGYLKRAESFMPKQGSEGPWYMRSNYFYDWFSVKFGSITDSVEFTKKKN